jgi:ATP sulfurylase
LLHPLSGATKDGDVALDVRVHCYRVLLERYYPQALYDELGGAERLSFTALKFEHSFYCNACRGMASTRTCPHGREDRLVLSGTRVREMLSRGEELPAELTRPEVAEVLRDAYAVGVPRRPCSRLRLPATGPIDRRSS